MRDDLELLEAFERQHRDGWRCPSVSRLRRNKVAATGIEDLVQRTFAATVAYQHQYRGDARSAAYQPDPNSSRPFEMPPSPSRSIASHGVLAVGQSTPVRSPFASGIERGAVRVRLTRGSRSLERREDDAQLDDDGSRKRSMLG